MVVVPPAQKPARVAAGGSEQGGVGGGAGLPDGGADAAAGGRDFGIGGAQRALLEFAGAIAREDGVGVGIDEAGEHNAPEGVDDFGVEREGAADVGARTDGDDAAVADAHGAVGDDADFAQLGAGARAGRAGEGQKLPAVENGKVGHGRADLRSAPDVHVPLQPALTLGGVEIRRVAPARLAGRPAAAGFGGIPEVRPATTRRVAAERSP